MSVKQELLKAERDTDALFCMLAGEILLAGALVVSNKTISFELASENKEFLEYAEKQLVRCFQISPETMKIKVVSKTKYVLTLNSQDGFRVLQELMIVFRNRDGEIEFRRDVNPNLMVDLPSKKNYLAGAFCGAGSISIPSQEGADRGGYHMEWVCQTEEKAETICQFLAEMDIISKKIERHGNYVVYLKESDAICKALAEMGAIKNMLELENHKVERLVRNNINRQSNCLSANLDKVMSASAKQVRAIEIIKSTIGIENLPEPLCEVALARLASPEASLSDLAVLTGGKISRAGISLRLKKLMEIAETLGEENE